MWGLNGHATRSNYFAGLPCLAKTLPRPAMSGLSGMHDLPGLLANEAFLSGACLALFAKLRCVSCPATTRSGWSGLGRTGGRACGQKLL
eukprot:gene17434-biopygen3859